MHGLMGIGERAWCDFVIYTEQGISIERIPFDQNLGERAPSQTHTLLGELCGSRDSTTCSSPWQTYS